MKYTDNLDPNTTPFLNNWENAQLAKARAYGIPFDSVEELDFKVISNMIKEHECEQIELTKRTAGVESTNTPANEDHFIGEYKKELIVKAIIFHFLLISLK